MARVSIEMRGAAEVLAFLRQHPKEARRASSRAANDSAKNAVSTISKKIREDYTVKAKYIKREIAVVKKTANVDDPVAMVRVSEDRLPVGAFSFTATLAGAKVKFRRAAAAVLYPRSFKARMKSGHEGVFWRGKLADGSESYQTRNGAEDKAALMRMVNAAKKKFPRWNKELAVRLKIYEPLGPSVVSLLSGPKDITEVLAKSGEYYRKRFDYWYQRYLNENR
jgi:hypothetical protein